MFHNVSLIIISSVTIELIKSPQHVPARAFGTYVCTSPLAALAESGKTDEKVRVETTVTDV